jgi:hypothetical protein
MYAAIIDWAKNYGFLWHEVDYKHKVPSPKGAELELKWTLHKKVSEYVTYDIVITSHIWNLLENEVEIDGKKKTLTSANLFIWLEPKVNFDWQKKGESGGKLTKKLKDWYDKLLSRDNSFHFDNLYYHAWNLHAVMKSFFDVQTKKNAFKRYME